MSDERVTEQLHRYGAWIEREAGFALRSATLVSRGDTTVHDRPHDVGEDVESGARTGWRFVRRPRSALVALAASVSLVVVAGVITLRPAGEPSALYTRASDPQGPLFVLPADHSGYVVSGGIINSMSTPLSRVTGRGWIGTPDESGTTFSDIVQVCVSPVAAECSSMPTPNNTSDQVEINDRLLPVTSSDDGSILVVSDQRDVFHVAVRGGAGHDPVELATLLTEVVIDDNGVPAVDVEAPRVVFATQGSVARIGTDRLHTTSFRVDGVADNGWIAVSTTTGTPVASSSEILPGGLELDEVSLTDEIIDDVTVTKLTFVMPDLGTIRTLLWQASPNRLISVGGPQASFTELTDIARSLVETTEADWKAALPEHQTFENSQPADAD